MARRGRQAARTARPRLYNKKGGCRRALRSLTPPGERALCVAPAAERPGVAAVRSAKKKDGRPAEGNGGGAVGANLKIKTPPPTRRRWAATAEKCQRRGSGLSQAARAEPRGETAAASTPERGEGGSRQTERGLPSSNRVERGF